MHFISISGLKHVVSHMGRSAERLTARSIVAARIYELTLPFHQAWCEVKQHLPHFLNRRLSLRSNIPQEPIIQLPRSVILPQMGENTATEFLLKNAKEKHKAQYERLQQEMFKDSLLMESALLPGVDVSGIAHIFEDLKKSKSNNKPTDL